MARKKIPDHALRVALSPTFIAHWRKYHGLSGAEAAHQVEELLGESFSESTYNRIENGKLGFTQRQIYGIAQVFRCTVADLLERDPHKEPTTLEELVRRASPEARSAIRTLLAPLKQRN